MHSGGFTKDGKAKGCICIESVGKVVVKFVQ